MFFPNPLPEVIFRGTLRRSRPKSAIFNGFWVPAGLQNCPLEHHFRPKRLPKVTLPSQMERPGANVGTIWRRKPPSNVFSSIRVPFLVDFGRILDQFGMNFQWLFIVFLNNFWMNYGIQVWTFFSKSSQNSKSTKLQKPKPSPHKPTNHFPKVLVRWNARKRLFLLYFLICGVGGMRR